MNQTKLNAVLEKNKILSPLFLKLGASSFFGTNEKVNPNSLNKLRKSVLAPNGYIIGVGVSSIFTALEAFSDLPKGIVLVNPDLKVITDIEMFISELRTGKVIYKDKEGKKYSYAPTGSEDENNEYLSVDKKIIPFDLLKNKATYLIRLAKEEKIIYLNQDLFDSSILKLLRSYLPEVDQSNNFINLSNVGDWFRRAVLNNSFMKRISNNKFIEMENLKILDPEKPYRNYFMYTSVNTDYFQTITDTIPNDPNQYSEINELKLLKMAAGKS